MVDVLVIGPHPDDIEICAGGLALVLAQQGYSVGGVDLTAGEAGTRGTAAQREHEAARGADLLGLAFRECLHLPDGRIQCDTETRDRIIAVIRRHRPRLVVAPIPVDHHPDHSRSGLLVKEARFLAGCSRVGPPGRPWRPGRVLSYPSREVFEPSLVVDVTTVFGRKMEAVAAHASQLHDAASWEPPTAIAAPGFLAMLEARARTAGALIGVTYGEPFMVDGPLAIQDPVQVVSDSSQRVFS